MTVAELIAKLQELPLDAEIWVAADSSIQEASQVEPLHADSIKAYVIE